MLGFSLTMLGFSLFVAGGLAYMLACKLSDNLGVPPSTPAKIGLAGVALVVIGGWLLVAPIVGVAREFLPADIEWTRPGQPFRF